MDVYSTDAEIHNNEIIGLNTNRELSDENMLNLTCYLLHYPKEVQCEA